MLYIDDIINENDESLYIKFNNLDEFIKIKILEVENNEFLDIEIRYDEKLENKKELIKNNVEKLLYSTIDNIVQNSSQILGCENVSN